MSLSPQRLLQLQARTPRYTSYPTAPAWRADLPPEAERAALAKVKGPASVYVHVPFCAEQCSFCACNQVVAGRREAGRRYLRALDRQIRSLPLARPQVEVRRIHLGGGTPTWYTSEELSELLDILHRRFPRVPGGELDVEVDPEITTDEQVDALAALGATRLSMGVQSFDAGVLEAVGRPQRAERIGDILQRARMHGMRGLNIDLMYGLPRQGLEVFERDLAATIALAPDRLAVFGYAHVPWMKPHQRRLEAYPMPGSEERLELFLLAHRRMREAGYVPIGFDHFARPDDELAVAARSGRLHRNFMGYTTLPDVEAIGLGMSAISELRHGWFQQKSQLSEWWKNVEEGRSTLEKGLILTWEDRLRKDVIGRIMCNLEVRWTELTERWGIDVHAHFAPELETLDSLEELGLLVRDEQRLLVTEDGRLVVRLVAAAFDAYLPKAGSVASAEALPRYSQLV